MGYLCVDASLCDCIQLVVSFLYLAEGSGQNFDFFVSIVFALKLHPQSASQHSSMANCSLCDNNFFLLPHNNDKATRCGKCFLRKPGLSKVELDIINVRLCCHFLLQLTDIFNNLKTKPQCAGCGACSEKIHTPFCNGCLQNLCTFTDRCQFSCSHIIRPTRRGHFLRYIDKLSITSHCAR